MYVNSPPEKYDSNKQNDLNNIDSNIDNPIQMHNTNASMPLLFDNPELFKNINHGYKIINRSTH